MRRISSIDELAARQHGVVARAQLLQTGWSESRVDREVRSRRLHRVHRGVYAVGHRPGTNEARWMAATLACHGTLGRHSAGALLTLPIADNGLTRVIVDHDVRRPGINTHRAALTAKDTTVRRGIPVTTIARTLADLAHTLDDESLHRVVREAQFKGLWDDAKIEDALTRRPARRLASYLGDDTPTQSHLEDRFLALCARHGIPTPQTQRGANPRVDFLWPQQRLVVEVDGWQAHRTRVAFQRDRTTTNALQLRGLTVLRYTHEDIARRDELVAAQVLYAGKFSSTQSAPSSARRYGRPPTST